MNLREIVQTDQVLLEDHWVGLFLKNGRPKLNFPTGLIPSQDRDGLRRQARQLLELLQDAHAFKEDCFEDYSNTTSISQFPLRSMQTLIEDYLASGKLITLPVEHFQLDSPGQIQWNRTLQSQTPFPNARGRLVYPHLISSKRSLTDDFLISQVHAYCLAVSFDYLGWIYTNSQPDLNVPLLNVELFRYQIHKTLSQTFNDRDVAILSCLSSIIDWVANDAHTSTQTYGTSRFDFVWEYLIDSIFGINDKVEYYPSTAWNALSDSSSYKNRRLKPDSIMLHQGKTFILDAKYYPFGITKNPENLPGSADINKQITYGNFVALKYGGPPLFNVFLLPGKTPSIFEPQFYSSVSWIESPKPHQIVHAVIFDTTTALESYASGKTRHIKDLLAQTIESASATLE